jgi:hypothetical protein
MGKFKNRLILLELNEVNFDVVEKYLQENAARFPALRALFFYKRIRTTAEQKYEELEPWIQWPSVHTTRTYSEHGIFRLGDIVKSDVPQIFEKLEEAGYKVGAISPMNAANRLKKPAYFIPDPWTQTPSDSSWWSKSLAEAVSQVVNDNARAKVALKSAFQIVAALLRFGRIAHYPKYIALILGSRRRPWLKTLVLDLLLHDIHWSMFSSKKPDFSVLFLNAGAHIQHHYFFNSAPLKKELSIRNPNWYVSEQEDPLADVLDLYDFIVGEYFSRSDTEIILATGLAQKPYDRVKFYYRLNSHAEFLKGLGLNFLGVNPRMTRDFLIEFSDEREALAAEKVLASIRVQADGLPLFGEIDNRGKSLFVTLTYPHEINDLTMYIVEGRAEKLMPEVSFVAIKNGMHQGEGFAFFTPGVESYLPGNMQHVGNIGKSILSYFGVAT